MAGELVVRPAASVTPDTTPAAAHVELLAAAFLAGYETRTRQSYATDLRQYFTWCATVPVDPLAASRAHVQVFARVLAEQLHRSKATVARKLSAVAGFYRYAVDENVIARSPAAHVRRPKISDESPRFGLDKDELIRLLDVAYRSNPVAYALVCLLALNGLRVSEACAATVADLSDERGHQLLTVTRKGGKRQPVPLAPRTAAAVAALPSLAAPRAAAAGDAGDVSPIRQGLASNVVGDAALLDLDRFTARRIIRGLAHNAGIAKPISPHSLRHTFVTLSLDAGVELHVVQDDAGHADPRTTQRYNRNRHRLDKAASYRLDDYLDNH